MTKTCTKCGETKPLDEYSRDRTRKDGRGARCKACVSEERRAYYKANRDKVAERDRAYRAANRDKVAERKRAYREANRDKLNEYHRAYYEANRDYANAVQRARMQEQQNLTLLTATRTDQPWEQWEYDYITRNPELTAYQIAVHLGRTSRAVANRRHRLRKINA